MRRVFLGAAVLAVIALVVGYLAPLVLNPESNLGPLFGIFFTWPVALVVGLVLGIVLNLAKVTNRVFYTSYALVATVMIPVILYLCLPADRRRDRIVEGEVTRCTSPSPLVDAAVKRWDTFALRPGPPLRPGWREDVARMLERDRGAVMTVKIDHQWDVYRRRKPWNDGALRISNSTRSGSVQSYFTSSECLPGQHVQFAEGWEASNVSPPDHLSSFLGLHTDRPVPADVRPLIASFK